MQSKSLNQKSIPDYQQKNKREKTYKLTETHKNKQKKHPRKGGRNKTNRKMTNTNKQTRKGKLI